MVEPSHAEIVNLDSKNYEGSKPRKDVHRHPLEEKLPSIILNHVMGDFLREISYVAIAGGSERTR